MYEKEKNLKEHKKDVLKEWLEVHIQETEIKSINICDKAIITIGRSKDRDIILPYNTISRKQCDIRRYKHPKSDIYIWTIFEGYYDEYNKRFLPKNPTLINGRSEQDHRKITLSDGDIIAFSRTRKYPFIIFNNIYNRKEKRQDYDEEKQTFGQEF